MNIHNITLTKARIWIQKLEDYRNIDSRCRNRNLKIQEGYGYKKSLARKIMIKRPLNIDL